MKLKGISDKGFTRIASSCKEAYIIDEKVAINVMDMTDDCLDEMILVLQDLFEKRGIVDFDLKNFLHDAASERMWYGKLEGGDEEVTNLELSTDSLVYAVVDSVAGDDSYFADLLEKEIQVDKLPSEEELREVLTPIARSCAEKIKAYWDELGGYWPGVEERPLGRGW